MNVSKAIAEDIAKKMILPMKENLQTKEQSLKDYVTIIVLNQIPTQVQKAYRQNKDFFNSCDYVSLINETVIINYLSVDTKKVPYNNKSNCYKCNNEQFDFVSKAKKDIEELEDEIRATKNSIISTLLSLRTIKKVIESFPDAAPYAEAYQKKSCTAVALPIKNISDILKKYSK